MYTILGSDQQQYGPVDETAVIQWIQSGQANAATMIHKEGAPDWAAVATFPEFATALSTAPPPVAAAPAATPTQAPKVFGILHIVFGVICGGSSGFGIFANLRTLALVPDDLKSYFLITAIVCGLGVLMYIFLLVGGIGMMIGVVLTLTYPIIVLIFMSKPNVKAALK